MARHRTHRALDKLIAGRSFPEVHRVLDLPALFLGRRHRILFHGLLSAPLIGALAAWAWGRDPVSGAASGWGHIALDWLTSWFGRQPGGRQVAQAAGLAAGVAQIAHYGQRGGIMGTDWTDPLVTLEGDLHDEQTAAARGTRPQQVPHQGPPSVSGRPTYRMRRSRNGRIAVSGGRINAWREDGQGSINARVDDLPDGLYESEIQELRLLHPGARTQSGRPGLPPPPPPPPGSPEARLDALRQQAEAADLQRQIALARAEATQAEMVSGHLRRKVEAKVHGTDGASLFWVGFFGFVVGCILAVPVRAAFGGFGSGAGEVAGIAIEIGAAWFAVWARLRRVSLERKAEEQRLERVTLREAVHARMEQHEQERPDVPPAPAAGPCPPEAAGARTLRG